MKVQEQDNTLSDEENERITGKMIFSYPGISVQKPVLNYEYENSEDVIDFGED